MKDYNYQPRVLVEQHYTIRNLIERQRKRTQDRNYHREIEKQRDENIKDIALAKDIELKEFWCSDCKMDFIARAKKIVDSWDLIAYYATKHPCGKWALRRITDRLGDEYWFKSLKVARDRFNAFDDTLQPFQSGYNMLYGKKN